MDVFQVATGRASTPNTGEGKFTGVQNPSFGDAMGLAGSLSSDTATNQLQKNEIEANEKDWLDQFVQFTQGLSNMGSAIGGSKGALALCWVAREVYGAENPRWLEFRNWLLTQAPIKLLQLYLLKGARFAKKISNKPRIKQAVRLWMDTKLGYNN